MSNAPPSVPFLSTQTAAGEALKNARMKRKAIDCPTQDEKSPGADSGELSSACQRAVQMSRQSRLSCLLAIHLRDLQGCTSECCRHILPGTNNRIACRNSGP